MRVLFWNGEVHPRVRAVAPAGLERRAALGKLHPQAELSPCEPLDVSPLPRGDRVTHLELCHSSRGRGEYKGYGKQNINFLDQLCYRQTAALFIPTAWCP